MKPEDAYNFFDDYDDVHGIFLDRENPIGAYGDMDAIDDILDDETIGPITMGAGADGIPGPCPTFDVMSILGASARVGHEELVCLLGPCKHYTECLVQKDGMRVMERYCDAALTWAGQIRLDDTNIYACSAHDPKEAVNPALVQKNRLQIMRRNEAAAKAVGHTLGICHDGACKHYIVMLTGGLDETGSISTTPKRWCRRLSGAARPHELDPYQPVLACTELTPGIPTDVLARNEALLLERRKADADRRPGNRQPSDE